jgi:hypothetical protein|nr:MAG TPA: Protein of unknown function (DUF4236) [Caudoviricetes sp.]
MGFFFRKRFRLCKGIDLNLSKNGVGVSVGVKGFRISRNAKGQTYLNCGSNGMYYRKRLDKSNTDLNTDEEMDKATAIGITIITIFLFVGTFFCIFVLNYGIVKSIFNTVMWIFTLPFIFFIGEIIHCTIKTDIETKVCENNDTKITENDINMLSIIISTMLMLISSFGTYIVCYFLKINYFKTLLYSIVSGVVVAIMAFVVFGVKNFIHADEKEDNTNT